MVVLDIPVLGGDKLTLIWVRANDTARNRTQGTNAVSERVDHA